MDASLMSNWLLAGSIAWSWPILGDVFDVSVLWVNCWVQAQTWQQGTEQDSINSRGGNRGTTTTSKSSRKFMQR